ncbi:MAG: glutamine-dependent synthetase [Betaproteobacteria bacterium]|jgi:NAD+ synthase (glutamine-hydrolysing)|nr:glutamine-dependent synthetase [Betaproteobacteria bacterium]
MQKKEQFFSLHRQGFVRVAACTPRCEVGDPKSNAQETLALMREGEKRNVDLMLFPELGISAYAIDDLLLQDALLDGVEEGLAQLVEASKALRPVFIVGAPVRRNARLYNCGVVISRGKILGVTPKSFLPNYREYYENRWFAPGFGVAGLDVKLAGETAPFGTDLIFAASDLPDFIFHIEICEDFWAADPPSTQGALAGALILCNLSASNIVVGKADDRALLCASQSMRCMAAYVYSAAGPGESTTDLAWDGQATIHELGVQLTCTERFPSKSQMCVADVDVERMRLERMRTLTFNSAAVAAGHPETAFRRVEFEHAPVFEDVGLERAIDRFPFVPDNPAKLDRDCYEAFNIQVQGLMKRMQVTNGERIVIGVSGGLDSTHALIVAAKAFDALKLPRKNILGFTMPGFATSQGTKSNAWTLMNALGVTGEEIDIKPAARLMLEQIGHPFAKGKPVYDVTFENVQAGLRTDYLFRLANQRKAFVLGTGDLSELALGWCTYGVGDHMSHYNVNGSVAKTLIQYLVRWVVKTKQFEEAAAVTLLSILDTEISPELVPADDKDQIQSTQSKVGPYELQDFHLFYITRYGLRPSKVAFLAWHAWRDSAHGQWPPDFPDDAKHAYTIGDIKKWLGVFLYRFFEISQYKRSALPNGPKVVSGGNLSPRGDWRAPSDGNARVWMDELERNVPT